MTEPTGAPATTVLRDDSDGIVDAVRGARDVVLLAHVGPDADALGSALALGLALRARAVRVQVSFGDDPFALPESLGFLPGLDLLVPPAELLEAVDAGWRPDLLVVLDSSSTDRAGVLTPLLDAAPVTAVLDHHVSYTGFGDLAWVDVASPSTTALVLALLDRLGLALDADVATCLYAGLVTDTGGFRFPNTSPDTHRMAARLLEQGIQHEEISRRLYDDVPIAALRLMAEAVLRAEVHDHVAPCGTPGPRLVTTTVSAEDRARHGLPLDVAERIVEALRAAREAEVTAVLKQEDGGAWRVSLRSSGGIDVGALASRHDGGGHRFAAGWTSWAPPEEIVALLRTALHAHVDSPPPGAPA